jgi:hypothetical protein
MAEIPRLNMYETARKSLILASESVGLVISAERLFGVSGKGELAATHLRKALLALDATENELAALDAKIATRAEELIARGVAEGVLSRRPK